MSETLEASRPVLIAWSAVEQREADPHAALDPIGLIAKAARQALAGADTDAILRQVDWIGVPESMTPYRDPGRLVARELAADAAKSYLFRIGVMQQTLISQALAAVQSQSARIALICGAEAKYRDLRARLAAVDLPLRAEPEDARPDQTYAPEHDLVLPCERNAGLRDAVSFYAVMESSHRAQHGRSIAENRADLGALYAGFTRVAQGNPHANRRELLSADQISDVADDNPMIAFPYTKRMVSSWTVDQASALFVTTEATAQELGIPQAQWIYPVLAVESNAMPALAERVEMTRPTAMATMAQAASRELGRPVGDVALLELYSCFPIAVKMAAEGLGVDGTGDLTLTGGMPFAGGPLNNYVLQASCRAADLLLASQADDAMALVSCVSGLYTKQGFTVWSRSAPERPYRLLDVTQDVLRAEPLIEVDDYAAGEGTIAGCTVLHDKGAPTRAIAVITLNTGARTAAASLDPAVMDRLETYESVGARVRVADGAFELI